MKEYASKISKRRQRESPTLLSLSRESQFVQAGIRRDGMLKVPAAYPDALYANWIQVLDASPTDSSHMVEGFVNSTEYRNPFVPWGEVRR
jgi:hypothetical protein